MMKKFNLIIAPLMTISFLASCGPKDMHTFTFTGEHCTINGVTSYSHDIHERDKNIQYTIVPNQGYALPKQLSGDAVNYDKDTGVITIPEIKSDIHVTAVSKERGEECLVSFDAGGGEVISANPVTVETNQPMEKPTLSNRPGYDVNAVKWFDKNGQEFDFDRGPSEDVILYAQWGDIKQYDVKFVIDNEEEPSLAQTVKYGYKIQRPTTPTKEGYTFDNWYTNAQYNTKFNFDQILTGESKNIAIYGRFKQTICNITYNANGGTLGMHTPSVRYGDKIMTPPTVTRTGYDSSEVTWWLDEAMTSQQFVFGGKGTPVESDINLYAKWGKINTFAVSFFENNGQSEPTIQEVEYGEKASYYLPTNDGYVFDGWYDKDPSESEALLYDFDTPITSNGVKIYAKWAKDVSYKLTYHYDNDETGKDTYTETYAYNKKTVKPSWVPTYFAHTFVGWYVSPGEGETGDKFKFGTLLTADTDIYAHWVSSEPKPGARTINFVCTNCNAYDENDRLITSISVPVISYSPRMAFHFKGIEPYDNPLRSSIKVLNSSAKEPVEFTWKNPYACEILVTLSDNLTIYAEGSDLKGKTLNDFSWPEISDISFGGLVGETAFKVGEERPVTLIEKGVDQPFSHTLRIIGINHDYLADGTGKAGITFEFSNLVTSKSHYLFSYNWGGDIDNYSTSTLNNAMNNDIYNMLPEVIKQIIRPAKKMVGESEFGSGVWEATPFYPKLFPLACAEMTADVPEGTTPNEDDKNGVYQYYKDHPDLDSRKKTGIFPDITGDDCNYWLRSPNKDSLDKAFMLSHYNGKIINAEANRIYGAVAPAFCV
ncbi:MAG: InlB B-repeat-containing protein [Bacilli bacterium]|nr:InlB B-repeat-containing protein [Bacilli bacterium]